MASRRQRDRRCCRIIRESRGVAVTAFGKPMLANPFPAMMARRLGTPLIAGRAVRLTGSRFRVEGIEIPVPVTDDPHADVRVATQALQDQFDAWISRAAGRVDVDSRPVAPEPPAATAATCRAIVPCQPPPDRSISAA